MLTQRDKDILIYLEKYHAISINQAHRIFFYKDKKGIVNKFGYDVARKRLMQLEEMLLLKDYLNITTNEKVYYTDRKVSAHDLYIMDFYSMLYSSGCKNIEFIKEPKYFKNQIRPDGYFKFEYEDDIYFVLLEVDLNSYTSLNKFQIYEMLYKSGELQKTCLGTFPIIFIMTYNRMIKYESENFEVVYSDFSLSDFKNILFGAN